MIPSHWAEFIGFLAVRDVTLYLQVLECNEREFEAQYEEVTGELPQSLEGAGYQVLAEDVNKFGNSSAIVFTARDSELFLAHCYSIASEFHGQVKKYPHDRTRQWVIYSNALAWKLLEYGFMLGTRQDLGRVRREVSEELLEAFERGVALGRKAS